MPLWKRGGGKTVNYIPELTKLANENVNFSESNLLGGGSVCPQTGYTIAALLGTSSGVPFKMMINGNSMERYEEFLPGLVTLGDILEKEGYANYFYAVPMRILAAGNSFLRNMVIIN